MKGENDMLSLIPYPKNVEESGKTVSLASTVFADECFAPAARALVAQAARLGVRLTEAAPGALRFVAAAGYAEEEYVLTVTPEGATVSASAMPGAFAAVSTLLQLLRPAKGGVTLPECAIRDLPDRAFRGMMVDLARDYHEIRHLYEYVDLCRFYKIRYLHLHFTDDQSYTLPSRVFPKLSTPGRFYSFEDLAAFNAYAEENGVEIIPEIDVPGHTTSFVAGYGEIFGTDGIICQNERSMAGMKALFTELCATFPHSSYIHIGGDEAQIAKWTECPRCLAAYRAAGVRTDGMEKTALAHLMYATFLREMCLTVLAEGRTPILWEGFAEENNDLIPREALVMSWENYYQTTPQLLAAGFRIVNCSWRPNYVVTPVAHWTPEEVLTTGIFAWQPIHPKSPYLNTGVRVAPTAQVEGGEILAWGDRIAALYADDIDKGVREEQALLEERAPALAEKTWNVENTPSAASFTARAATLASLFAGIERH